MMDLGCRAQKTTKPRLKARLGWPKNSPRGEFILSDQLMVIWRGVCALERGSSSVSTPSSKMALMCSWSS